MSEMRKPAVALKQGKHTLYFTAFTVSDLIKRDSFYRVNRIDVYAKTGLQRLLNKGRARVLGKDLIASKGKFSLPTSIFLATEGEIDFDEARGEIAFDASPAARVCPFDVIDGQHRIEGLRAAVESSDDEKLLNFEVSAVVAPKMSEPQRMLQFVVVNTKQQKVSVGVKQHIIARFTKKFGLEDLPYIPQWLQREINKGDDARALDIVKCLNGDEDSPWYGLIQLADSDQPVRDFAVKQNVIVTALKKYLLTPNHMLEQITPDRDKQLAILKNYWTTVRELFVGDDPRKSVAFKSNGLAFFLTIANPILNILARRGNSFTVSDFKDAFAGVGGQLDGDTGMLEKLFWNTGGVASSQNLEAIMRYVRGFNDAAQEVVCGSE